MHILRAESVASNGNPPENMLTVRASNMKRVLIPSGKKMPLKSGDEKHIYEHCGDHRLKQQVGGRRGGNFVDPLLKLYLHAPLMLVTNEDVPNGHANGTRVILESVVLRSGCTPDIISINKRKCFSVEAAQVEHLLCSADGNPSKKFRS